MTRIRRVLIAAVCAVGAVLLGAAPAYAHASLESTSPGAGSVVHAPVHQVTATFDETVGVSDDSLRVYSPDGSRVDLGTTRSVGSGSTIAIRLRAHLVDGTYTVAWHVVSADSHPVSGAFTFSIGHRSRHVLISSVHQASPVVRVGYAVVRGVAFAAYAVFAGGLLFLASCWRRGWSSAPMTRLLLIGWLTSCVAAALTLLLQGVYAGAAPLIHLLDPNLLVATLRSRLGLMVMIRLQLLVAAGVGIVAVAMAPQPVRARIGRWQTSLCGLGAVALAATWSLSDHASVGRQWPIAVAADVAHLCAMAWWLGGLVVLFAVTLRPCGADAIQPGTGADAFESASADMGSGAADAFESASADMGSGAADAVARFSPIAGVCVATILVTGTYQAWRNVGTWAALFHTTYGWLIIVKIVGICCLIVLGYGARRLLGHRLLTGVARRGSNETVAGDARPTVGAELGQLRRMVRVELVLLASILAVTALLVETPTGREAYHPIATATRSFSTGTRSGSVTITVTPSRLGPQVLHVSLDDASGQPYRPAQLTAALSLASQGIGPLQVPVQSTAKGVYVSAPVPVDVAGTWSLSLLIRSDAFDETTVTFPVPIS